MFLFAVQQAENFGKVVVEKKLKAATLVAFPGMFGQNWQDVSSHNTLHNRPCRMPLPIRP